MEAQPPAHSQREVWRLINVLGENMWVGYQISKDRDNRREHKGISLAEGIVVLSDHNVLIDEEDQGPDKQKYIGKGSSRGSILTCITEWVSDGIDIEFAAVRIISVFPSSPENKREYMAGNINEDVPPQKIENEKIRTLRSGQEYLANYARAHRLAWVARQKAKNETPSE